MCVAQTHPDPKTGVLETAAGVQVICWELLTEKHFYNVMMTPEEVLAALNGDAQLPSEQPLDEAVDR